jgi:hypothetical protein
MYHFLAWYVPIQPVDYTCGLNWDIPSQEVILQQGCCQADIRMCSHCLFPVVVTSLEQVVIALLQGYIMTVTDLLQIVPIIQTVPIKFPRACCHQLVTCRRYQAFWNNLLRV